MKRIAEENFNFIEKNITISNGVEVCKLISIKNNILKIKNFNNRTILSISYLFSQKGIDFNLKAISKIANKYPNLKYLIIGDGLEKDHLKRLSKNLGIDQMVEFLGQLSHENVFAYMAKADIFSLPSWDEAFGVVYIEAMAHGKPVIGCQGEGIEDFVMQGKTGLLVKPKDVDSLTEALDFLLYNQEEAKAMGVRAQKVILENYTWEKNAKKTIEVYNQALNDVH